MAKVTEILSQKGSQVLSIGENATVMDGALLMNEHKVGALVVTDNGRVIGMFTERDILSRVVVERRDPATTKVGEVLTRDVVCSAPTTTIEEARGLMKNCRIRHLPVVDKAKKLIGLISIGDLNAWKLDGHEKTIHGLHEYLYGRV